MMLTFGQLQEKKTKVKINPKKDDLMETPKKHGEDCTCIKCDKRRENDEGGEGPTVESWKPEIEHIKGSDLRKKAAEKKRKEAESSLPPHLKLDAMKKAFAHTNEGVADAVLSGTYHQIKTGAKRHKDAVEKKKIKNRKAVPYAALAAEHQPEGEMVEGSAYGITKGDGKPKGAMAAFAKRHPRDQKELDKAKEYIKKNPNFGKKDVKEAKVDQKLPDYKRATARDKRYGNPHGSHELGGGIRKDRRADHEKRRGVKEETFMDFIKKAQSNNINLIHNTHVEESYASQEKVSEERSEEIRTENILTFGEATRLKKEKGYDKGGSKDRALNYVKTKIRKEYGKPEGQRKKVKGAKSDAGTGKYKRRADDKKAYAAKAKKAGFKSTQDYTNTMARYGGEDNYKKGRGLGT